MQKQQPQPSIKEVLNYQTLSKMWKENKISYKFIDYQQIRKIGGQKDHWISEIIFEQFLYKYLPHLQSKKYEDILESLKLLDSETDKKLHYLCCYSFYMILIAESTRVESPTGEDLQSKNTTFSDMAKNYFTRAEGFQGELIYKQLKRMLYQEGSYSFFDDRITYSHLKLDKNSFELIKSKVQSFIDQIMLYKLYGVTK